MKTLLKAIALGAVAAGTFEILRRTGVVQKVADRAQFLVAGFAEDETDDDVVIVGMSDGMRR